MSIAIESEIRGQPEVRSAWKTRLSIIALCVALTSVAVLPFFVIGEDQKIGCCGGEMPVTHDSWMHYNQMNAFWQSLSAGIAYPRWDENTHGYGAPTTSFYPPGIYYVTSAVYFVTRNWRWTWAGFYWLTMLASAAALYTYARQNLSRGASLVAMTVYVFAPYHLLNQYQRGAMSEFTSFIWVPLCLLFAERVIRAKTAHRGGAEIAEKARSGNSDWRNFAGLAASFGAFLWTHPPTAYQFVLVFGTCAAVAAIIQRRWRASARSAAWLVAALVFGSMLAAAYFYPAMVEQQLVNYDDVERTWPYHASYVFDYAQTVYDHVGNPFFARLDRIWAFNLTVILLCAAVAVRFNAGRLRSQIWLWTAAGLLASFLMTKFSAPVGCLIPKIETGVYSWRMLTLTSVVMAMLAGAAVNGAQAITAGDRERVSWGRLLVAGRSLPLAVLTLPGVLAMSAWYVAWPMWRGQSFEPNPEHYNYATLPRGAMRENPPMPAVQLASGKGTIHIERWTPEFRRLRVEMAEADQLQFRTRNFAGWTAVVEGQITTINEGAVKNIVVNMPAGEHRVTLEFRPTPVRRAGKWITLVSFILLVSLVVAKRRS